MEPRWRIELLGGLRALVPTGSGSQIVGRFETRKAAALLAYLACHPGRAHPREVLIELLWPEEDPGATRARFRQTLAGLRRDLEPPGADAGSLLLADRTGVQLRPGAVETDVAELESALRGDVRETATARAGRLTRAVELYRGELLPGFYEEWVQPERMRLHDSIQRALTELAATLAELGDLTGAICHARRAVALDPLREAAHAELMRLFATAGRRADALRQFRELERLLRAELNSAPGAEACALLREIESGSGGGGVAGTGPPQHPTPQLQRADSGSAAPTHRPEPPGGAVPLGSAFYVERATDAEFAQAIARGDSIVLVKGPRQVGKTSLLARGLHAARQGGARVVLTDFQTLTPAQLETTESLLFHLAVLLGQALDLGRTPEEAWDHRQGWNVNFPRYLQFEALARLEAPLVWGMDEVDRLFTCPFASEVFGLFRSWHNARALDPDAPWTRLTLAIAHATEAHLFITDLNQSPFNVGTRLTLDDFSPIQVAELNRRHGSPLRDSEEVERFFRLVGGHPYLARCGLHEMVSRGRDLPAIEGLATRVDGPFSDHLRRMALSLSRDPELCTAMRAVLDGRPCPGATSFYRLRSAGLLTGETPEEARPRCGLYRSYLERHLATQP